MIVFWYRNYKSLRKINSLYTDLYQDFNKNLKYMSCSSNGTYKYNAYEHDHLHPVSMGRSLVSASLYTIILGIMTLHITVLQNHSSQ